MLKLSNVSYSNTKKSENLVNNVTLEVRDADYIVISGQNEAERRALLEILGAVAAPKMGDVYIDGIELSKHTPNQLTLLRRGVFGYFLNDSNFETALTVGENIQLPLVFAGFNNEEINVKLDRVLNIVGLIGFKNIAVDKLTEWQKNKLQIAIAIVKEPKVLILDEPCRIQDESRLAEVLGLLSALNRDGVTIIVSSNNEAYFKVAKRRVEIANGAIIEIKKERAPRDTGKKTKTKKTAKTAKTVDKSVVAVEIKPQVESELKAIEEKQRKVVKSKKAEVKEDVEQVVAEEKTKKSAGRPKKVADIKPEESTKTEEVKSVTKTRKKKGVESDANTIG